MCREKFSGELLAGDLSNGDFDGGLGQNGEEEAESRR